MREGKQTRPFPFTGRPGETARPSNWCMSVPVSNHVNLSSVNCARAPSAVTRSAGQRRSAGLLLKITTLPMASTSVSHRLPSERAPSVLSSSSKLTAPGNSTLSLTRRILFPHLPPSSPPPPLLQTSASCPALDAELYDLIALALRAYINPWWTKITRYDKQLLLELTRILTSVLRTMEARALAADLSPLLYLDLPTLLAQHCADYRVAARKLGSSYAAAGSASLPVLFHGQQQHVGVSIDGKADEVYVRAAVDVVLKACLSPEDWDAEAERYLIREIIVKTVCIDIAPRITQPWFLHSTLLDLLGPPDEPLEVSTFLRVTSLLLFPAAILQS